MLPFGGNYLVTDSETFLFRPGLLAPKPVCLQSTLGPGVSGRIDALFRTGYVCQPFFPPPGYCDPDLDVSVMLREHGADFLQAALEEPDLHIVGHNIAFDLCCFGAQRRQLVPLIVAAYDAGRIHDTRVREKLFRIATGEMSSDFSAGPAKQAKFGLDVVVMRRFSVDLSEGKHGQDSPRKRYGEVDGVPVKNWPTTPPFLEYAVGDPYWTERVFLDQSSLHQPELEALPAVLVNEQGLITNELEQTRAAFSMHLMAVWGVRSDGALIDEISEAFDKAIEEADVVLREHKVLVSKTTKKRGELLATVTWHKNAKAVKTRVVQHFLDKEPRESGLTVEEVLEDPSLLPDLPKTEGGDVSTKAEFLDQILDEQEDEDPVLRALVDTASMRNQRDVWVPVLKFGASAPICAGWNELVETGRTSCFQPNFQNPPKKGRIRECLIPRPGWLFVGTDYSQIELCALGQVHLDLFGESTMADKINAGFDLHIFLLAVMMGKTYEETLEAYKAEEVWAVEGRQMCKAGNFGYPGGLGPKKFIKYAKDSFKVVMDRDPDVALYKAKQLKDKWFTAWPENEAFHEYVSSMSPFGQTFTLVQHRSGRIRGDCIFTVGCNSFFQGLAADGAKRAMWYITRACYADPSSPLYGCRLVLFIHDEFVLEAPAERAAEAAMELKRLAVKGMQEYIPDVAIRTDPVLMERWYKKAKPVFDANDRLTVWRPT